MKQYFNPFRTVFFLGFIIIATACAGGMTESLPSDSSDTTGAEAADGENEDSEALPSPGRNVEYIYVHPYDGNPETAWAIADLLSWFGGRVVVADPEKNYPIDWENEETIPTDVDPEDISGVKQEDGNPDSYDCVLDSSATGSGTNTLPAMDASWKGYGQGGCGTWATAMCNRILGESDGEVTQEEWNGIADGIGQDDAGGSTMSDQSKYYEDKGYCVTEKKFGGSEGDYQEMEDQIDDECDVKLFVWKRNEDGTFTNGHVETVTEASAESGSCTTNSWGEEATVSGGNDGDFSHSRDGSAFRDSEGNGLWPADGTEVWVAYVCECSVLESIGRFLGL